MLFLLLLFNSINLAQKPLQIKEFGKFNNANSFAVSPSGWFYVSEIGNNEIIKLDTNGTIRKTIGGFGWDSYSFDEPSDIYANSLNVYIADKNNDRIQIYDKDLNYISSFTTRNKVSENYSFRYPTSVAIFSQGDFFVLDSDNTRILKFNSRGEFQSEIGSYGTNTYTLTYPKKFTINNEGIIFVIESKSLILFDLFGNFISKTDFEFELLNINSIFNSITITAKNKVIINSKNRNLHFDVIEIPDIEITDALIFSNKLFVLSSKKITVFQLVD
jgi:hypothetical protein